MMDERNTFTLTCDGPGPHHDGSFGNTSGVSTYANVRREEVIKSATRLGWVLKPFNDDGTGAVRCYCPGCGHLLRAAEPPAPPVGPLEQIIRDMKGELIESGADVSRADDQIIAALEDIMAGLDKRNNATIAALKKIAALDKQS